MIEEDLIIEMWDIFKEYIPEKNRENAAGHYVDFLVGKDVSSSILASIVGYDVHLDSAISLVLDDGSDEEEDEEDHWSDEEDEDH